MALGTAPTERLPQLPRGRGGVGREKKKLLTVRNVTALPKFKKTKDKLRQLRNTHGIFICLPRLLNPQGGGTRSPGSGGDAVGRLWTGLRKRPTTGREDSPPGVTSRTKFQFGINMSLRPPNTC